MEDEVDLRELIGAILRQWKFILGLALLGAMIGGLWGFWAQPRYEATALITMAGPPYSLRLEQVNQGSVPAPAYADLARSDNLLLEVLSRLPAEDVPASNPVRWLRSRLHVEEARDRTLYRLAVTDSDPERAARLANIWAEVVVVQAALLYGPGAEQLQQYEAELGEAQAELEAAEQALAEFQAENRVPVLRAQRDSQQFSLADYLNRAHRFPLLIEAARDLLARLDGLDPQAPASPSDEAALLLLVTQASTSAVQPLNDTGLQPAQAGVGGAVAPSLIQVQIGAGGASTQTVGQLAAATRAFAEALEARTAEAAAQAETLQPALLAVQGQLGEAEAAESALRRDRDLADSRYRSLVSKLDQVRIAAQDAGSSVRLLGAALVPQDPLPAGRLLKALAGAGLGLIAGTLAALLRQWWLTPRAEAEAPAAVERERERFERASA